MDTGPAIRLATMHWHSASGCPTVPQMDPSGTPCPGAPGGARPGGPRGAREISRARGAPGAGAPGGPRGGPKWGPRGPPKWPLFGAYYYSFCTKKGGPGGVPPGCAVPPGGPPGPGGAKSAHFFGYLITLPVGTVLGLFLGPPRGAILGGIQARASHMGVSGAPPPPVIGLSHGHCPSPCAACSTLPERLGSMAATGPASAPSALVGGT